MGARIIYNGEFQHYGILGQKWGVITRNVGVNYVPIGNRSGSSAKDTVTRVAKGVGQGVSGAAKAVVRGAQKAKSSYDTHQAKKAEEKRLNNHRENLSKKDIAKMTDAEVQATINRRQKEQQLYDMDHPVMKAGKDFFSSYVAKSLMELGGQYAKKFIGLKADEALRNFIKNNDRYTEDQKRDLLYRMNIENLSDTLARQGYEDKVRSDQKLKNIDEDVAYEIKKYNATRDAIDKMNAPEEVKNQLKQQLGVENKSERYAREAGEGLGRQLAKESAYNQYITDNNLSKSQARNLREQGGIATINDKVAREVEKGAIAARAKIQLYNIGNIYPEDSIERQAYQKSGSNTGGGGGKKGKKKSS